MKQYEVTGMSCAACSARVEKAVSKIEGVTSCSVNLLTNSMGVEGAVDAQTVIEAVEAAGYKAAEKESRTGQEAGRMEKSGELKDKETPEMKKRLIASRIYHPIIHLTFLRSVAYNLLGSRNIGCQNCLSFFLCFPVHRCKHRYLMP